MKMIILLLCLLLPYLAFASNVYDNDYCKDPVELQKWANLIEKSPDSDAIAALHAMWIGLCVKVEAHNLTTVRANKIFDDLRAALIEEIEAQEDQSESLPGPT